MKYSKGDKVIIRNIDWYEDMLSIPSKLVWQNKLTEDFIGIWCGSHVFRKEMREFCGRVMTIQEVGIDCYLMEEDRMGYEFTDEMIAGEDVSWMYDGNLVSERFNDGITSSTPKFKVGDVIVKKDGLTNSYLVSSVGSDYYGLSLISPNSNGVGVLPVKEQDEWELLSDSNAEDIVNSHYEDELEEMAKSHNKDILNDLYNLGMENSRKEAIKLGISSEHIVCPDGYEFRDGDGNLIAVDKIVLVKKRQKYPQSFEECCEVLSIPSYYKLRYSTYEHGYHEYTTSKDLGVLQSELGTLGRLIICRNAYWLTAGREMGLEGMWKPDWSDCRKFSIVVEGDKILTDVCLRRNRLLVFPTEEMRDEFLKVFGKDIETCKEFL
jgi:hypothetical protein